MHVAILQHVPFEGAGSIESWLQARGARQRLIPLHAGASLPEPQTFDLLIVLGGPMSVNDEADYPWLQAEKQLLARVIDAGKPVLGICLGAQLMAAALGARVTPGAHKEIGWFPLQGHPVAEGDFQFPEQITVFHWHGETFSLPAGARLLASSAACRHQAFQLGRRAIGLQCHLETTPQSAASLIAACRDELTAAPFIQDEASLLATPQRHYSAINQLMHTLLDYLVAPTPPTPSMAAP